MRRSRLALFVVPLAIAATTLVAAPAHAQVETLFGTTVEVIILPSSDSLLGETAYVPSTGGGVIVTIGAVQPENVVFELREGATVLSTCTIPSGGGSCSTSVPSLSGGAHSVTARFTQGATVVDLTGTLFSVISAAPSVALEWQDASGTWVDGSAIGLPLFGDIAMRCTVTNNSNAPFTFNSFSGSVSYSGAPPSTPITGTLAGGATGHYPIWSGAATDQPSGNCNGGVMLADGTGTGNGIGGGVIGVDGTIEVSPALAPGRTVTVVGSDLYPPVVSTFQVLFDGEPVDGSPVTLSGGPDYAFSIDVDIPEKLAPGTHAISIVGSYSGRDVVFAYFPLTIEAPALPATGADAVLPTAAGLGFLLLGAALLVLTARRRRA